MTCTLRGLNNPMFNQERIKPMNKIFKLALCSVLALNFTACTEEVDYTPATPSQVTDQVYFMASNTAAPVMQKDDTQFTVLVGRDNSSSAQSVPLKVTNPNPEIFTVPATIEFAAGEAEKELVVQASSSMELAKNYYLKLEIAEEFVNPYKAQDNHPIIELSILKEDYELYAVGTYTAGFFSNQSWKQEMQYSPALDMYRFTDLWATGYHVAFKWDGSKITCANTTVQSGYVHPTYGMCSATVEATAYEAESNAFLFTYNWTVSAGTFGSFVDQFILEELK